MNLNLAIFVALLIKSKPPPFAATNLRDCSYKIWLWDRLYFEALEFLLLKVASVLERKLPMLILRREGIGR